MNNEKMLQYEIDKLTQQLNYLLGERNELCKMLDVYPGELKEAVSILQRIVILQYQANKVLGGGVHTK